MTTTLPTIGITFAVDDVTPGTKLFPTKSLRQTLTKGIGKEAPKKEVSMTLMAAPARSPYQQIGLQVASDTVVDVWRGGHPLIDAVHLAFANHLPLTFSPDMIWQCIVQGVAHHVLSAPEEHRSLFVKFDGKSKMQIVRSDLSLSDLEGIGAALESIVGDFTKGLGEQVTPAYLEALTQSFSTTGPTECTAARIALMEIFSPYFDYEMYCGCGFPSITLTGSPDDWRVLRSKVHQIEELFHVNDALNLTWWTSKLRIMLDQFVAASEGNPDREWWKRMYKQMDQYMNTAFNGWIGWLWPYTEAHATYTKDGGWTKPVSPWRRNPMLEDISDTVAIIENPEGELWGYSTDSDGKRIPESRREFTFGDDNQRVLSVQGFMTFVKGSCFLSTRDFPLGKSSVPLKIVDARTQQELDTTLVGGFMGVAQSEDGGLTPQLGYTLLV